MKKINSNLNNISNPVIYQTVNTYTVIYQIARAVRSRLNSACLYLLIYTRKKNQHVLVYQVEIRSFYTLKTRQRCFNTNTQTDRPV